MANFLQHRSSYAKQVGFVPEKQCHVQQCAPFKDETGIGNAIITPDIMDQHRIVITSEKFLLLEGVLQNQDGVISVRVERVAPLRELYSPDQTDITDAEVRSHDFH